MVNNYNTATITYNTGSMNVKEVQLVFRDTANLNTYIIDSFDKTVHRSGKYFIQVSDEDTGEYQSSELICVHNGITPQIAVYGVTFTGAANLATFSANISGNDVNLNATPVGNVNIKTFATLMKI